MEKTKNISDELWGLYDEAKKKTEFRLAFDILVQIQDCENVKRVQEIRSIVKEEIKNSLGGC